ncbi:hypothetical protein NKJ16_08485 [Mesorhizobium sp. M0179]|uniref:hypothetical protein n=1 Tax=Mesorhizobium sp. M0179 TaxID=2956905 RepID=UPI003335C629
MTGRSVHPLGFETDNLSFGQMSALVDALSTVTAVLSGLQEQPRFSGEKEPYNEAGGILEELRNNISCEIDDLRDAALARRVSSRGDGEHKFGILIGLYGSGGDNPTAVVAELAKLAAGIDWELAKKGGAK